MRRLLPALLLLAACGPKPEALPRISEIPSFRLTGTTAGGAAFPVEKRDLLKKPWVAGFLYTSCGGPCPSLAASMGRLEKQLGGRARLVVVTVDPKTDTPEVLAKYAKELGAGPDWWFLTGDEKEVAHLVREGFKLAAVEDPKAPKEARVTHSIKLALVDGANYVRGYYDSTEPESLQKLLADLASL